MRNLTALISGLLFSAGLTVSQMVDPQKVLAFLDIFGNWDPSLAFVMGGGLLVYALGYAMLRRRLAKPVLASRFHLPTRRDLDGKLLSGAALFGIGWGMAGVCPGPALASLGSGSGSVALFVASMLGGLWIGGWLSNRSSVVSEDEDQAVC